MRRAGVHVAALAAIAACDGRSSSTSSDGAVVGDGSGVDQATDDALIPANLVFVTSTKHVAGSLGGLAGADAICQARASAAGLPGTYVAWLSTTTVDARDRLGTARGWRRPDGLPFVDTQGALLNGRILYPAMVDETGARVPALGELVITNTVGEGTAATTDCGGFASTAGDTFMGIPAGTTRTWTEGDYRGQAVSCATAARLYCFGIDLNVAVATPQHEGPRAFIDRAEWWPAGGFANADARCQATATSFGLTGTFKALLASTTASAADRFDLSRPPWVRLDGVRLAASRAAFMAAELDTSPSIFADGMYDRGYPLIWTGGAGTGTSRPTDIGNATRSCMDWTDTTSNIHGGFGMSQIAGPQFFDGGGNGGYLCHDVGGVAPPRLLCLEE